MHTPKIISYNICYFLGSYSLIYLTITQYDKYVPVGCAYLNKKVLTYTRTACILKLSKGDKPKRKETNTMKKFDEFRFAGLNARQYSNKYATMDRVSADEGKIVVKVAGTQIFKSKYGYGLILDDTHVLWLKDWQVSDNFYGIEVLMNRDYFKPTQYGNFPEFGENEENLTYEAWVNAAKEQAAAKWTETVVIDEETGETEEEERTNMVRWAI